jgi:Protein kinase domain
MNFNSFKLTDLENFSLSYEVIKQINKNPKIGQVEKRIIGLVGIFFTQLADTLGHLTLACGKGLTGVLTVSLYVVTFGHTTVSREFNVLSALIHIARTIESLFSAIILPFVCLINPLWAQNWKQYSYSTQKILLNDEITSLKKEIETNQVHTVENNKKLQASHKQLTDQLNEKERVIQVLEDKITSEEQTHTSNENEQKTMLTNLLLELQNTQEERNQIQQEIDTLRNQIKFNQANVEETNKQLQEGHAQIVEKLNNQLVQQAEQLRTKEAELSAQINQANEKLDQFQKQLIDQWGEKEQAIQVLKEEITLKEQQHNSRKDELKEALAAMQNNQQGKIQIEQEVEKLRNEIKVNQFEALKIKAQLRIKHSEEVDGLKKQHEQQMQQLQHNLEDSEKQKEIEILKNQLQAAQEELDKIHQMEKSSTSSFIDLATDDQNNSYSQISVIGIEADKSSDLGNTIPVACGKVKQVWKKEGEDDYVYYTPLHLKGAGENELREEVETAKKIRQKLGNEESYLAIDLQAVEDQERIKVNNNPLFTIKTKKAERDLENLLSDKSVTFQQRVIISKQVLQGICNLHLAGYCHGDLKPENILVYKQNNQLIVRLSDFGKTVLKKPVEQAPSIQGNPRFVPTEFTTSEKGEVSGSFD